MSKVLLGLPEKVFDGEGGAYYPWSSSKMPVLGDARVGAGRILLHRQGYAIPHLADSTKLAFVLQGEAMAGLISPDTKKETVVRLKKGDCITITKGLVSWWYNPGDSGLDVVFIGETSDAIVPGEFTYQFLSGTNGLLNSFSSQFLSSLYSIPAKEAGRLGSSQAGMLAVKLQDGTGPAPDLPKQDCFNFCRVAPDLEVTCGAGLIKRFTSGEDDVVKVGPTVDVGAELSAFEIKLEPKSGVPPLYMARPAAQVFFVVKGSAWVQIVSGNGGLQLDQHVDPGHLFVVPKFYTVAMVAGDEGLECLSVMNTNKPVLGQLGNIWSALSPGALEAALDLKIEDIENADKIKKALIIIPPKK